VIRAGLVAVLVAGVLVAPQPRVGGSVGCAALPAGTVMHVGDRCATGDKITEDDPRWIPSSERVK
jgi:hypothetical protein